MSDANDVIESDDIKILDHPVDEKDVSVKCDEMQVAEAHENVSSCEDPIENTGLQQSDRIEEETPMLAHSDDAMEDEPVAMRRLFVGGLNYRTDCSSVRLHFERFGQITECSVMRDQSGKSRGFGFVAFAKSDSINELMKSRPHYIDGRELDVRRATPKEFSGRQGAQSVARKLFVGSVKDGTTDEALKSYFSKYGNIVDCAVVKNAEGKPRGFGFVTFDDYDPVDRIVLEKTHTIDGYDVDVQKATPKRRNLKTPPDDYIGHGSYQKQAPPAPPPLPPPSGQGGGGYMYLPSGGGGNYDYGWDSGQVGSVLQSYPHYCPYYAPTPDDPSGWRGKRRRRHGSNKYP
ncbi:hypothetical protein ACOME3_003016 [Neoechinorhynchus agilis]